MTIDARTIDARTTSVNEVDADRNEHDWAQAGRAWGHAANDWSCLFEHYAVEVMTAIFERVGVGPDTNVLDIACGSGLAERHAEAVGATVAGIDAAVDLLDVARRRVPTADLRLGSMFELPWEAETFDAAVSINGIWGGCERALDEAARVLRPGAKIGISFWGTGRPLDLRECFKAFARHAPQEHFGSMKRLNNIGASGVAEEMLAASGFDVLERGGRVSILEWPDPEIAWRALASIGPAVPALEHGDVDVLRRDVLTSIESCRDVSGVYRFRNDHQFVIARKS
ncbi:MAG: class I SAM-dependent methyltransferase [Ilumatobacter sp.]